LTALAAVLTGWLGQLSATSITALGCLTLGVGLSRLIPWSWLVTGVLAMCAIDVVLIGLGMGATASSAMNAATAQIHGPVLDRGGMGPITIDYPDLVLTAILGASVAGDKRMQPIAALLLAAFGAAYGLLLPSVGGLLPATVPIAATFVVVRPGGRLAARLHRAHGGPDRQSAGSSAARSPARSADPNTTRLRVAT
jgi:hypothetical protein